MMETRSRAAFSRARPPPPSLFSSLPKEIHARIIHFLNYTEDLLAVACVASSLNSLAVSQLWQRLDFSTSLLWFETKKKRERIAAILYKLSAGFGPLVRVREVRLPATPEAADLMLDVLGMVGHRLTRLEFRPSFSESGCRCRRMTHVDHKKMLDVLLFKSNISLPSLTHVELDYGSYCRYELFPLLCSRAPNLLDLDCDLDNNEGRSCEKLRNTMDVFVGPTQLQSIRVTSDYPNHDGIEAVANLIEASPELRRLIMRIRLPSHPSIRNYHESNPSEPPVPYGLEYTRLRDSLSQHTQLQSLYWSTDIIMRDEALDDSHTGLKGLITLIVRCEWSDTFVWQYKLPNLERLFVDHCSLPWSLFREILRESAPSFPAQILLHFCKFADFLRSCPRLLVLHTIQADSHIDDFDMFDRLDVWSGQPSGQVGSISRGEDELICARLLVDFEEVEDREWRKEEMEIDANGVENEEAEIPDEEYLLSGTTYSLRYTARDGTMRERVYEKRAESVRMVLCDYKGLPVPIEVVQAMWDVEGLSGEPWERRGVSVGESAWKVLTDWYEGLVQGEDFLDMGQLSSDEEYDQSDDEDDWSQSQCTQYTQ